MIEIRIATRYSMFLFFLNIDYIDAYNEKFFAQKYILLYKNCRHRLIFYLFFGLLNILYFCNRFFNNEMSRIKVVHIVEALGGGVYTYFKNLTHFFGSAEVTKEIDTIIIYSSKRKEIDPENIKKDFSENVTLIEVDMVRELSPFHDFRSTIQLKKLLKELNPDLIHLHSSKAGVLGRLANSLLFSNKKQIFYTPHGYSFLRQDISAPQRALFRFIEKYSQRFFGGTTIACETRSMK